MPVCLFQEYLADPHATTSGAKVKSYVIAGRHTALLALQEFKEGKLSTDGMMREAKVYLLSDLTEPGAMILGAKDNLLAVDAARFKMSFFESVRRYCIST
jgi:hypothetical protein